MTNYEYIKSLSYEDLISFFSKFENDSTPWYNWWIKYYCNNKRCSHEISEKGGYIHPCDSPGVICQHFPDIKDKDWDSMNKGIIEKWLNSEHI